ncbi:hypothetical protein E3N88_03372 [Mikania micrantha]|uniref:Uncharacterized protein n=1 Tax=Mikania micrantha TaxID=192012 RepID=A0A5N6Q860_9ASTR|nr:hypothetical protein E3N88_03372 [Mikania micrantha]
MSILLLLALLAAAATTTAHEVPTKQDKTTTVVVEGKVYCLNLAFLLRFENKVLFEKNYEAVIYGIGPLAFRPTNCLIVTQKSLTKLDLLVFVSIFTLLIGSLPDIVLFLHNFLDEMK